MKENNSKQDIKVKESKKPDIKIFVSHRIDMEAETIDNPLYVNVRCGAVYDKRENIDMLGDNTGDNISEKRESFNELTVMYWAWKNVDADYYGLCHYRRYLSFADNKFNTRKDGGGFIDEQYIDKSMINKYCLNEEKMREEIIKYDWITSPFEEIDKYPDGPFKNVFHLFQNRLRDIDINAFKNILIPIIEKKYPEMKPFIYKYFNGNKVKYYNSFVMKKELFNKYASFIFDILFEVEKKLDTINYNIWKMRTPGFMAEHLTGIFFYYIQSLNKYKIKINELVFFQNTKKEKELQPAYKHNNIPVVFSSSNEYIPYASVYLQSIIDNSKNENNYDIIILEKDISQQNKDIILNMVKEYSNISIRFYNPSKLVRTYKFIINPNNSEVSYYRIIVPHILKNYNGKILVSDCDLITAVDIADIYKEELGDNVIGAAKDVVWQSWCNGYIGKELIKYNNDTLNMKRPLDYVNTGIILFNANKYRNEYTIDYVLKFITSKKYKIQEQDGLNAMLEGRIKFLDIKWNMYVLLNEWLKTGVENYCSIKERDAYFEAYKNPNIIHWAAHPKPWVEPSILLAEKWWEIARKTPFYEMILQRMVYEQSNHISFTKLDHFSRIMFPFKWLKKVHKVGYIRQIADKLLPHGTKRRKIVKKLIYG